MRFSKCDAEYRSGHWRALATLADARHDREGIHPPTVHGRGSRSAARGCMTLL